MDTWIWETKISLHTTRTNYHYDYSRAARLGAGEEAHAGSGRSKAFRTSTSSVPLRPASQGCVFYIRVPALSHFTQTQEGRHTVRKSVWVWVSAMEPIRVRLTGASVSIVVAVRIRGITHGPHGARFEGSFLSKEPSERSKESPSA